MYIYIEREGHSCGSNSAGFGKAQMVGRVPFWDPTLYPIVTYPIPSPPGVLFGPPAFTPATCRGPAVLTPVGRKERPFQENGRERRAAFLNW